VESRAADEVAGRRNSDGVAWWRAGTAASPRCRIHDRVRDAAMNLAVWVERQGRWRPDAPALADGERVHADWAAFAARTAGSAAGLRDEFGLSPGDRVAILMRNRPEYVEALFAIWHAGLVAVPVNARLHRDEIGYILEHSESAVVVTDDDHAGVGESLVGAIASLKAAVVGPGERWGGLTASSPAALVDRKPNDPAWLFYTSGTTGRPKGATLTHRNLLMASLSYFADIDPVMPQDAVLHAAPLSHGSGLYGLPHVARGAVSVVPESGGVDGEEIAALLHRWPGMSFFAAPTMVKRLAGDRAIAASDLSHLKTIIYGGAPMYLADLEDALAVFGPRLAQIYGQGETPMTITALSKADHGDRDHPEWRDRMQSVGVPRTDVEVRVVDGDDRDLPVGEVGEVVVRGDVVMAGYWRQPDATRRGPARRVAAHWRRRQLRRARVPHAAGPVEGPDHQRGHEHLPPRGRGGAAVPPRRPGGRRRRPIAHRVG
jgi:acyl-CoA synthetase (AMP-forming)/AMP-acid ligase II